MLQDSKGKVKIQGQLTEAFGLQRSLKQDDALSTALLSVGLEKVIRNIESNLNRTICNGTMQYIAFVVDTWIVGRTVKAMEEVVAE